MPQTIQKARQILRTEADYRQKVNSKDDKLAAAVVLAVTSLWLPGGTWSCPCAGPGPECAPCSRPASVIRWTGACRRCGRDPASAHSSSSARQQPKKM